MGSKLRVVSVDLSEDPGVVKAFARKNKATFTIAIASDKIAELYKIAAIPSNLVVAPDGTIVYAAEGYEEKEIVAAAAKAAHKSTTRKVSNTQDAAGEDHPATAGSTDAETSTAANTLTADKPDSSTDASRSATNASTPRRDRPFADVPPDHWAAPAVELLRLRGIVIGYP